MNMSVRIVTDAKELEAAIARLQAAGSVVSAAFKVKFPRVIDAVDLITTLTPMNDLHIKAAPSLALLTFMQEHSV